MKLCNGERCLHTDTLIVVCYALFCICFGLTVAFVVVFLDKRRERKAKASAGVEAMETTDGRKPLSRRQSELDEVHRTLTIYQAGECWKVHRQVGRHARQSINSEEGIQCFSNRQERVKCLRKI